MTDTPPLGPEVSSGKLGTPWERMQTGNVTDALDLLLPALGLFEEPHAVIAAAHQKAASVIASRRRRRGLADTLEVAEGRTAFVGVVGLAVTTIVRTGDNVDVTPFWARYLDLAAAAIATQRRRLLGSSWNFGEDPHRSVSHTNGLMWRSAFL